MAFQGIHCSVQDLVALEHRAAGLTRGGKRRSREIVAGGQRAPFRGRGMDYAESRPYSAGDDARHIDWRVSARSGNLHSKLFHPERDRISVVVAQSADRLRFGTRVCFKSTQSAQVAALFLWAAQKQGDRCMVSCFGDRSEEVPPQHARKGIVRLLSRLASWQLPPPEQGEMASGSGLQKALRNLSRHVRSGAHVLVLADESSMDASAIAALAACQKHNDVLVGLLIDPIEYAAIPAGVYPILQGKHLQGQHLQGQDLHNQQAVGTRLGDARAAQAWREHFALRWQDVTARLREHGIRSGLVCTAVDSVEALHRVLGDAGVQR